MSGYILCQVKKAEKPFYIENISTNIYSIEELCYYLYNNLYLVDRSLISNKLCTWLDEELKLPKLAAKLRPLEKRQVWRKFCIRYLKRSIIWLMKNFVS